MEYIDDDCTTDAGDHSYPTQFSPSGKIEKTLLQMTYSSCPASSPQNRQPYIFRVHLSGTKETLQGRLVADIREILYYRNSRRLFRLPQPQMDQYRRMTRVIENKQHGGKIFPEGCPFCQVDLDARIGGVSQLEGVIIGGVS